MGSAEWWWILQIVTLVIQCMTLGFLIKYTMETQQMRKNAQQQNKLISDQLELSRQTFEKQLERERAAARPFIHWGEGGIGGPSSLSKTINFTNEGGQVIVIETRSSSCVVEFPLEFLKQEQQFAVKTDGAISEAAFFGFKYETSLGELEIMAFEVSAGIWHPRRLLRSAAYESWGQVRKNTIHSQK